MSVKVSGLTARPAYYLKIIGAPRGFLGLLNKAVSDRLPMMDGALIRMRVKFCIAFAFIIVAVGELRSQGFLIPDTTRRDVVFDFAGQNLYISTSTGLIKTFDLSTFVFGRSYDLGGSLWGIDIARDDSFILAAQNSIGAGQGVFERVNLLTGAI